MNMIYNDLGDFVVAVGAPNSIERAKVQFPKLIKTLNDIYYVSAHQFEPDRGLADANKFLDKQGVINEMERMSCLMASDFNKTYVSQDVSDIDVEDLG